MNSSISYLCKLISSEDQMRYSKDHRSESLTTNSTWVTRHLAVEWNICYTGLYIHRIPLERHTKKLAMVFISEERNLREWGWDNRVTFFYVHTFLYYMISVFSTICVHITPINKCKVMNIMYSRDQQPMACNLFLYGLWVKYGIYNFKVF